MSEQTGIYRKFADIHSHIIFGADDGAGNLTEAIELLKLDRDEGAYAIFATPHYGTALCFTPESGLVRQNFELIRQRAAEEVPEVRLYLGMECHCEPKLAEKLRKQKALRLNDTDYVLVEFKEFGGEHESADTIVKNLMILKSEGFRPVLAHPERYESLQDEKEWDKLRMLAEKGILLQVNAFDLEVQLSLKTKELAQWLAKERLISFIGSDMHGMRRKPRMEEGIQWLYEHTDESYADAVTFGNAEALLGI